MKKIKIMLLSFALLAIVGGALAFKAKFNLIFCYTTTTGAGSTPSCPVSTQNVTTTNHGSAGVPVYYTTTPVFLQGYGVTCYTWVDESETATKTLSCPTSWFVIPD